MPEPAAPFNRTWHRWYDPGVPATVEIPPVVLPRFLQGTAERYGERTAIVFMERSLTFAELYREAARFASVLRARGIKPGDRVALLFPNVPHEVVAYYGAHLAGAVVVQVNPLGTPADMAHALRDSGARALVALDALLGRFMAGLGDVRLDVVLVSRIADWLPAALKLGFHLKAWLGKVPLPPPRFGEDLGRALAGTEPSAGPVPGSPEDPALLQYTGGTTGTPKAAVLTHRNLVANVKQCVAWMGERPLGTDVALLAIPFFHVYGMTVGMNQSVRNAQTMVLHARWDPEAVMRSIARHRATIFPGVQVFYQTINQHPRAGRYDLKSVRLCISGAGPLMQEVQETFERNTGARVVEGYGLTEASPVTHCNPLFGRRKVGTIGVPLPSTDARLVDLETGTRVLGPGEAGELCVSGPQVMRGYWNRDADTREVLRDGWLHTGDVAVMDEEGFFRIVDRKKEMIKSGGENVYPRNVEEVLFRHPAVQDAAVVGVPDAKLGEKVKGFVVLKPGAAAAPPDLISFCRASLPGYAAPKEIEVRAELPRTQVGKLLRRVLAEEERKKAAGAGDA